MKLIVFLLNVALTTASSVCLEGTSAPVCYKYLKGDNLEEGACLKNNRSGNIFVRPCTAPQYCPVSEAQNVNMCTDPLPITGLNPGELCTNGAECSSKSCIGGRCKGLGLNNKCTTVIDCDPDLRCDKEKPQDPYNKCLATRGIGEECASFLDCSFPLQCVKKKCVKPRSQSDGTPVDGKDEFDEWACESYYITEIKISDKEVKRFCDKAPKLTNQTEPLKEPLKCKEHSDCKYDNQEIEDGCRCGKTENGSSYCKVYPGDFDLAGVFFF